MATLKLSMFFEDNYGTGWAESLHYVGSTVSPSALNTEIDLLVYYRTLMLSQDCRVNWVRIQGPHNRDPFIFSYFNKVNGNGQYVGTVNTPTDALLVRLESTGVGYNRIFMHGIADTLVVNDQFLPSVPWQAAFNQWSNHIISSGFYAVYSAVDNPQPAVMIVKGVPLPGRGWIATVAPPGVLPVGGAVRIKGSSVLGYNGTKNVLQANPQGNPNTYLMGGAAPQQSSNVADNILAFPKGFLTGLPDDVFPERITSHRVGRPFGLRLGRRQTTLPLRR